MKFALHGALSRLDERAEGRILRVDEVLGVASHDRMQRFVRVDRATVGAEQGHAQLRAFEYRAELRLTGKERALRFLTCQFCGESQRIALNVAQFASMAASERAPKSPAERQRKDDAGGDAV